MTLYHFKNINGKSDHSTDFAKANNHAFHTNTLVMWEIEPGVVKTHEPIKILAEGMICNGFHNHYVEK